MPKQKGSQKIDDKVLKKGKKDTDQKKAGKTSGDGKSTKPIASAKDITAGPVNVTPVEILNPIPTGISLIARTRADVDVYLIPKAGGEKLDDRYPADCLVEILEEGSGWYKVKPVYIQRVKPGYVEQAALIFPEPEKPPVFPQIFPTAGAAAVPSVPHTTKLKAFREWQSLAGKPEWIPEIAWASLDSTGQAGLLASILTSINADPARWENWLADVTAAKRLDEAVMDEWIVRVNGGRELFVVRDHNVYREPVQNGNYFGSAVASQVMRWTGNVRFNIENDKRVVFYEVDFYRMHLAMHGWFRADLTGEYIFPTSLNDPKVKNNAKNVFDLSVSPLRHPQDPQISPERKKGLLGAQYIDIFEATKKHLVHWCLCGEFCVSTLSGSDVIPVLRKWIESKYADVQRILNDPHEGTGIGDLKSIMKIFGLECETYTSIPTTPQRIKDRLSAGQYVLAGCGINKAGEIMADGKIRHWVVIEDILPVGNSGWVRVYNPFFNQDEVYEYNLFIKSSGVGAGLWIFPKAQQPAQV